MTVWPEGHRNGPSTDVDKITRTPSPPPAVHRPAPAVYSAVVSGFECPSDPERPEPVEAPARDSAVSAASTNVEVFTDAAVDRLEQHRVKRHDRFPAALAAHPR